MNLEHFTRAWDAGVWAASEGPEAAEQYLGLIWVFKGHLAAVWGKVASKLSGKH